MGCYNNKIVLTAGDKLLVSTIFDLRIHRMDFNSLYLVLFGDKYTGEVDHSKLISKEEFIQIAKRNLCGDEKLLLKLGGIQMFIFEEMSKLCVVNKEDSRICCWKVLNYLISFLDEDLNNKIDQFIQINIKTLEFEHSICSNKNLQFVIRNYLECNLIFFTKATLDYIFKKKIDISEKETAEILNQLKSCHKENFRNFMANKLNISFDSSNTGITQKETFRFILKQNKFIFNIYQLRASYNEGYYECSSMKLVYDDFDFSILTDDRYSTK